MIKFRNQINSIDENFKELVIKIFITKLRISYLIGATLR